MGVGPHRDHAHELSRREGKERQYLWDPQDLKSWLEHITREAGDGQPKARYNPDRWRPPINGGVRGGMGKQQAAWEGGGRAAERGAEVGFEMG